jgi:hypothetical protein
MPPIADLIRPCIGVLMTVGCTGVLTDIPTTVPPAAASTIPIDGVHGEDRKAKRGKTRGGLTRERR